MVRRYPTNPLDDQPGDRLTFSDLTLLALLAVGALLLGTVLALGTLCADHRIAAALATLF